jgi:hypothetical protein
MSTRIGENIENCIFEIARNGLKTVHHGWRTFLNLYLKWLEGH